MIILNMEQRSPEWYEARLGVPTASCFDSIITAAKGQLSTGADGYIDELLDELCRPDAVRGFAGNRHTDRGNELEPDARAWYSLQSDDEVSQVGIVFSDDRRAACSPDSLVGSIGGLEIKCPDGPTHVGYLRGGKLPDKYKQQVHGSLAITGLQWWDFVSYCPPYPSLCVRVVRDEYTDKTAAALAEFLARYEQAKSKFMEGTL